jgi:hypothetical protein
MGIQTLERVIEGRKGGLLSEEGLEARTQCVNRGWIGITLVRLEVGVERPEFVAHPFLVLAMALIERDELVNQAFGMHPTQGMQQNRWPGTSAG